MTVIVYFYPMQMFELFYQWLFLGVVILQGADFVLGRFASGPKQSMPVHRSFTQNTGQLGTNTILDNMLSHRQYYNTLMGRMMEINKSKTGNRNQNNVDVDEIMEWRFTDPHNLVDTWAPPSGRWEYFGDWRESDRSRFNDAAPAAAVRRTNIIKYFFRRGILFSPKLDGSDVPRQVHDIPVFHSRPMVNFANILNYSASI